MRVKRKEPNKAQWLTMIAYTTFPWYVFDIFVRIQDSHRYQLRLLQTSKRVEIVDGTYKFILAPSEHRIFTVSFHPKSSSKHQMYLVVRYVIVEGRVNSSMERFALGTT